MPSGKEADGVSPGNRESIAPFLRERVGELKDWNDIKLLSVAVDRLRQWSRAGLLCIGDSAHAMSPVGGVGINLAIQDAVAAANILARPLLHRHSSAMDGSRRCSGAANFPRASLRESRSSRTGILLVRALRKRRPIAASRWRCGSCRGSRYCGAFRARWWEYGVRPEHVRTPEDETAESTLKLKNGANRAGVPGRDPR